MAPATEKLTLSVTGRKLSILLLPSQSLSTFVPKSANRYVGLVYPSASTGINIGIRASKGSAAAALVRCSSSMGICDGLAPAKGLRPPRTGAMGIPRTWECGGPE